MAQPLTIDIKSGSNQNTASPATSGIIQNKESSNIFKNVYAIQLAKNAVNIGKDIIQYNASQIGNTTGNYMQQKDVERGLETASTMINLVGGAAIGFLLGNPIISAISIGTTLTQMAVNQIQSNITYQRNISKANYKASMLASDLGIILNGGNR